MKLSNQDKELLNLHYAWPATYPKMKQFISKQTGNRNILHLSTLQNNKILEKLSITSSMPLFELLVEKGIYPIPYTHSDYPSQLKNLIDPPAVIYTKGDRNLLKKEKATAIIGSRKATVYSKKAMERIVPPLVKHDYVIISGLARGADTLSHKAAIEYGGRTIAVLGSGFFHIYPKENEELAQQISHNHLLVTEYPPYQQPTKWTFPMRNRIISGLSRSLVITESAERSGTMTTIEHALDHGKEVFAVPGPIDSPLSLGPNKLLNEGAQPIWSGYQIVETFVDS